MAKAWATRRANAVRKRNLRVADALSPHAEAINLYHDDLKDFGRGRALGNQAATERQLTEMAKEAPPMMLAEAEHLARLARKPNNVEAVRQELLRHRMLAKHDGESASADRANKRIVESQRLTHDRIVCDWIAEVETDMAINRGLQPGSTYILGSHLVCRIIDALNQAGYTAAGVQRPANKATG